jgi:hypothetical protein
LEKSLSELNIFIKLFVLLYADDTVILADSVEGMQNALDIFQTFFPCNIKSKFCFILRLLNIIIFVLAIFISSFQNSQ